MVIPIIHTEKHELTITITHHITNWYVRLALPMSIDITWHEHVLGQKNKTLNIEFLCFLFSIEYWKWNIRGDE